MRNVMIAVVVLALAVMMPMCGCVARVGSASSTDIKGTGYTNGSPNTIGLTGVDENWTANGTGPQQYTQMDDSGLQTFRQGSTPREIFYDKATGRLVISSGSDVSAEGISFDPESGKVKVAKFSTVSSEPIRAGNEAFDRLVTYWSARDEASKEAIVEALKTATNIAPDVKDVLLQLLTSL
jgi:hypothetical protein